jgi:hypothetical protein
MIQETEDMINLVKSSKYKGDKTEIEICSDYIKDLKKHKLKKIKSIKEKGDKNVKNLIKPKNDNKINLDKEEDKKDYNEWVDIDDNMNEKGEILIEKNTTSLKDSDIRINSLKDSDKRINSIRDSDIRVNSLKDSDIKINVNKKDEKPNKKEKKTKISIKNSEIDDNLNEIKKMQEELLKYSEMDNYINERQNKINQMEYNAEKLARDSEMYIKAAKKIKKKNKFLSWSNYNDNDFKAEEINKSKIICYISLILIIISIIVTLIVLFFH